MKSKRRKRVIASVLCMVLMLSTGMSTLAEADAGTVPAVEETTAAQTTAQETKSTSTDAQTAETETQTQTETETQTETKQTEEAAQTKQEETTAAQPTEEASGGETTQTDQTAQNTQDQTTSAETSGTETQNETVETQPVQATEKNTALKEIAFDKEYKNDEVKIHVYAESGVFPENTQLIVTPIVKRDINNFSDTEEKNSVREINEKYDETLKKLEETVENDPVKEIAGFLAYDISFQVKNADGTTAEIEPNGNVSVEMEFAEAMQPEGVDKDTSIESVDIVHMKESGTEIKAETLADATVSMTKDEKVQDVSFESNDFSIFTITWTKTGEGSFDSFSTQVHAVVADENGYREIDGAPVDEYEISSEGTPPTLYMDTISADGENKELYEFETDDGNMYRFSQAFVASGNGNNFTLKNGVPITAIQAIKKDEVRYKLEGTGEYQVKGNDEEIIFVYTTDSETTQASYYSEDGRKLGNEGYNFTNIAGNNNGVQVSEGHEPTGARSIYGYQYSYTLIKKGGQEIIPTFMRYTNGYLQYSLSIEESDPEERDWVNVGLAEIRLIYIPNTALPTVDTSKTVDIGLFQWQEDRRHDLYFQNSSGGSKWNKWTGYTFFNSGRRTLNGRNLAMQGIVKNRLVDETGNPVDETYSSGGYPELSERVGSGSLEYLFSNGYTGLNHLFQVDEKGYYYFDSAQDYAYFNSQSGNKNFTVYDNAVNKGADDTGDFTPFAATNEKPGSSSTAYENNYYFSMNVGFNFTQPENGKVDGEDMIFKFTGDDDVWVFIDGQLVLDIGGIHDAVGGEINFSTGEVKVVSGKKVWNESYRTLDADQPRALTVSDDGLVNTTTRLRDIFQLDGTTFDDNSTHRLEFFYLERGAGESNCSLRFNLQLQESKTLEVKKEITNTDKEKYSDVEFDFRIELEDAVGSGTYNVIPEGTKYTIKKDEVVVGMGTVGKNGIFTLKHGESAVFEDINPKLKYIVEEQSVQSDEFDQVMINGKDADYYNEDGIPVNIDGGLITGGQDYIAKTQKLTLGQVSKVVFGNRCSSSNLRELKITKQMASGQKTDDYFSFKIELEGQDGELQLYEGDYYLKNHAGQNVYWNGSEYVPYNGSESSQTCGKIENGIVERVPVGYTVALTQILSGTEFRVTEILNAGMQEKYEDPIYKVEEGTAENIQNNRDYAQGEIKLKEDALVYVTNRYQNSIQVVKEWKPTTPANNVAIYVGLYSKEGDSLKPIEGQFKSLNNANQWTESFVNLEENREYIIRELQQVGTGQNGDFEIDGTWYKAVNKGETVTIDGSKYEVMYSVEEITANQTEPMKITNTKAWQIAKISSTSTPQSKIYLPGAEFTIVKDLAEGDGEEKTYYGKSDEKGIIKWYTSDQYTDISRIPISALTDGEYLLSETKAPDGYAKNSIQWKVKIENGQPIIGGETSYLLNGIETFDYENDPVYSLPSSGGPGIFWYTISGALLLMAGTLILYNLKKGEVLKK